MIHLARGKHPLHIQTLHLHTYGNYLHYALCKRWYCETGEITYETAVA